MGVLRVILAISVVLAHSGPLLGFELVGGMIAVQSFYIISGFYMSLILNEKYIGKNGAYKLFISNRFLRLYPLYWVVLIITFAVSLFLHFNTGGANNGYLESYFNPNYHLNIGSWVFLIFSNVFIFLQDIALFMGIDPETGVMYFAKDISLTEPKLYSYQLIRQGWTVGLELMFYLIAPFIVRRKLYVILMLIAISLTARIICYMNGLDFDPWTYRFFPFELVFFLMGVVGYHAYLYLKKKEMNKYLYFALLAALIGFTIVYSKVDFQGQIFFYYSLVFISIPFIFILTKKSKFDRWIGELSYPIYISHLLVILIADIIYVPYVGGYGGTILILTVGFSFLLNFLVARPIEKLRQRRVKM